MSQCKANNNPHNGPFNRAGKTSLNRYMKQKHPAREHETQWNNKNKKATSPFYFSLHLFKVQHNQNCCLPYTKIFQYHATI